MRGLIAVATFHICWKSVKTHVASTTSFVNIRTYFERDSIRCEVKFRRDLKNILIDFIIYRRAPPGGGVVAVSIPGRSKTTFGGEYGLWLR